MNAEFIRDGLGIGQMGMDEIQRSFIRGIFFIAIVGNVQPFQLKIYGITL